MPRSTTGKDDSARKTRDPRRAEILREARLLAAAALLLLLLTALVTAPLGDGSGTVGAVGAFLARYTFLGLGMTAFLVLPLGLFWLGLRFFRRGNARPWERGSGLLLVTLSTAAGLALTVGTSRYAVLAEGGPGGVVGALVRDGLVFALGSVGAFLAVLVGFLVGLALFTDWLIFEMAAEGLSAVRAALPWFRRLLWPEPVTAASAAAGSGGAVSERPARRPPAGRPAEKAEEEAPPPPAEPAPSPPAEPPARTPAPEPPARPAAARETAAPEPPATAPPRPRPRPRKRKPGDADWEFPSLDLLDRVKVREVRAEEETIQENARILEQTLSDFRIEARVVGFTRGPVVTMYEIDLAAGIKVTRIHALADDMAMALKAQSVRVVAPIPGKSTVGVEVPNPTRDDVRMRGLLETDTYQRSRASIPLLIGVDAGGTHRIEDLTSMPHLLIAGATGSGKSVCINSIIMSVLMTRTPEEVRLILIDPKQVELSFFARIPHLLAPVVTDMKRATNVLEWACQQMDERYDLLARMQVRSIASYNELGEAKIREKCAEQGIEDREIPSRLPYVVIVVDELADLMMTAGKEVEVLVTRLAQKSRAVGIHVVLATQRPSTDVITGLIKANMPTRLCFKVTSKVDSRVVLDQNGGDKLLGQGDMLYLPPRTANLIRAQATFVSDAEVKRVVEWLADRQEPQFNRELTQVCNGALLSDDEKDELYDQAVRIVLEEQRGSASLLQRALEIGYTRASRLLDLMRREGIVGAYRGSKASDVTVTLEEYEARVAKARETVVHTSDEVEEEYGDDDEGDGVEDGV